MVIIDLLENIVDSQSYPTVKHRFADLEKECYINEYMIRKLVLCR